MILQQVKDSRLYNSRTFGESSYERRKRPLMPFKTCNKYKTNYKYLILGTGENNKILEFYKKRGFQESHRLQNFFINNYEHPIFEEGKQLIDMIYLKKIL